MTNPTAARIELRNRNFDLVKVLDKIRKDVSWDYNRIGGCGNCNISLAAEELMDIGADYDIQMRLEDGLGGTNLVYRGYAESNRPIVDVRPSLTLQGFGYYGQLARVKVKHTYTTQEISLIVKDILDNYVLPDTSITYSAADIEATGFTIDSIDFDDMADKALKTLADIAGKIEWGVDVNRNFFFKAQDDAVKYRLRYGIDIAKYDPVDEYRDIINRIYIKGGTIGGVQFEETVDNLESQGYYGLRSIVKSNSSILTSAVAQRYGTMILAETAKVQKRVSLRIANNSIFFEQTLPMGRISVIGKNIVSAKKYGDADAIYGRFKYGGNPSFQVDRISYKIMNEGTQATISGGYAKPDIAEQIKRLDFEISQIRNV